MCCMDAVGLFLKNMPCAMGPGFVASVTHLKGIKQK